MWPKLQNIGEKWFILSFDLRVFIEKSGPGEITACRNQAGEGHFRLLPSRDESRYSMAG
jgi:hypothetical protein